MNFLSFLSCFFILLKEFCDRLVLGKSVNMWMLVEGLSDGIVVFRLLDGLFLFLSGFRVMCVMDGVVGLCGLVSIDVVDFFIRLIYFMLRVIVSGVWDFLVIFSSFG